METILTGNIWRQANVHAKGATRRLVAVAYVSDVKHLKLRRDDVLICDASDRTIRTGETSAKALQELVRKGVEVWSFPDLHAKAAVLGRYALVGSCNLSISSAEVLTELALLTDRRQVVAQVAAFIHGLREESVRVEDAFLKRILKIKVSIRTRRQGQKKRAKVSLGNRVWLVSLRELRSDSYPKERPFVEEAEKEAEALVADKDASVSWIRWTGKCRFRSLARPGDIVVQIFKNLSGKRITVYAPCPIVLRQDVDHWTRFYIEDLEDHEALPWRQFEKRWAELGLSRVGKNTVRELKAREVLLLDGIWN